MGEDLDPSVIQKTQQKLGKYIQKPQLTEKLLRRPPFRFLHDIVTAAIKQYGVLDGVFSSKELVSDNLKEKEDKLAFLQKLINHIAAESAQELSVRPSKILAGAEAEKTNELLVALASLLEKGNKQNGRSQQPASNNKIANGDHSNAKVATNGMSTNNKAATQKRSTELVSKPAGKTNEANNKPVKPIHKEAAGSKPTVNSKPVAAKPTPVKATAPSTKSDKPSKPSDPRSKDPSTSRSSKPAEPSFVESSRKAKSPKQLSIRPPAEFIPVPPDETLGIIEEDEPVKDTSSSAVRPSSTAQLSPELASSDSGITLEHPLSGVRSSRNNSARNGLVTEDDGIDPGDGPLGAADEDNNSSDTRELSGKAPERITTLTPPRSALQNSFEKPIAIKGSERPSSNRPPSGNGSLARPKSSRRPPSRTIRDRLSVIRQDSSRPATGQVPRVIVEGNTLSDDEEDRIVQGAVFDQTAADLTRSGAEEFLGGEQGKLVEQILSAQREFDPSADVDFGSKDGASSSAEVQRLKGLIQEMAQSALPLGQLIPLIHEDMEIMQQEWQVWKREADSLEEVYNREKVAADKAVEKLETELEQLEEAVRDQESKLNAARASVLRSEGDVSLVISTFGKDR